MVLHPAPNLRKVVFRSDKGSACENKQHFQGKGGRTTRLDPPQTVAYTEEFGTYREALHREAQVKRWTRAKKETLVGGDIERLKKLAKRRA